MHRSWIVILPFIVACGPAVGEPGVDSGDDGSSGAASTSDASPSTSSASGGVETSAATGEATAASDETGEPADELPTDAAGDWLCAGFEDSIFLRLWSGRGMPWDGRACGPDLSGDPPHEWTNCDDLGFGHANSLGTQAYWTFELPYEAIGGPMIAFELGVDYVPEDDTLQGSIYASSLGSFTPETCMRYEE